MSESNKRINTLADRAKEALGWIPRVGVMQGIQNVLGKPRPKAAEPQATGVVAAA